MKAKQKIYFHNRFDIEIRDKYTGEIKQKGYAENIILDQMYTRLCAFSTYFINIHFGSGTGVLSPTRTSLFTHLGTKVASYVEVIRAYPTGKVVKSITLAPEEFVDSTFTEVGIAFGATNTNLVTHAMIKDSEGNPLSLTKTALDVLVIYATVFVTLSEANGIDFGINGGGMLEYLTGKLLSATLKSSFKTGLLHAEIPPTFTYTADSANKKVTLVAPRLAITSNPPVGFPLTDLVFGRVGSTNLAMTNYLARLTLSDTPIVNETVGIGDGANRNFKTNWSPVVSDSLTLKADGVLINTNHYTVIYNKPLRTNYNLIYGMFAHGDEPGAEGSSMEASHIYQFPGSYQPATKNSIYLLDDIVRAVGISSLGVRVQSSYQVLRAYVKKFNSTTLIQIGTITAGSTGGTAMTMNINYPLEDWAECEYLYLRSDTSEYKLESVNAISANLDNYLPTFNIVFNEGYAPALDAVITADYTVKGLPKTSDYIVDASIEIQFGEGA